MKTSEFRDSIESLLEREAETVETFLSTNKKPAKVYVVASELVNSWLDPPA